MATTYALVDVEGNVLETRHPKKGKGFVILKGGQYQVSRRFIRQRTRPGFLGLFPVKDRIIYFVEPFVGPHQFYAMTDEMKAAIGRDSAWALKTMSEATEMEKMYEKKKDEVPWILLVLLLSVAANVMLAVQAAV